MLAEMFPDACSLDIEHCLTIANGDIESAVQLMLLKSERSPTVGKENTQEILDFSPKVHVCGQIHTFRKSVTLSHFVFQGGLIGLIFTGYSICSWPLRTPIPL